MIIVIALRKTACSWITFLNPQKLRKSVLFVYIHIEHRVHPWSIQLEHSQILWIFRSAPHISKGNCFIFFFSFHILSLAHTEKIIDDVSIERQSSPSPSMSSKSKSLGGLRSIFGKLRRSNSGNLEDLPLDGSEFRRGGVRATAGPRLGWNNVPMTDMR